MTKKAVTYRLRDQALSYLAQIIRKTGSTKTATIETALAMMAQHCKGFNPMTSIEDKKRSRLEQEFYDLNVGELEELHDLEIYILDKMVSELQAAQNSDQLNLETSQGVQNLSIIVEKVLKESRMFDVEMYVDYLLQRDCIESPEEYQKFVKGLTIVQLRQHLSQQFEDVPDAEDVFDWAENR